MKGRPVIGLTGGIGSGKSSVADLLAARGAGVVDTDAISRDLTGPAGKAMEQLRAAFGAKFVARDGSLDRAAMRALAFEDAEARGRLESILHPAIRAEADAALARVTGPYAVLVVPLLFETGGYGGRVTRTLVVDCPEDLQVERTVRRSGLTPEQVRAIMATQWPRARRVAAADDVILNAGTPEELEARCAQVHARYVALAAVAR